MLTSRGIQKSYLIVLKSKNRKGTQIYNEYWLLDKNKKEDYQGVIFVQKIKESVRVNDDSLGVNDDLLGVNDDSLGQKESKKERKGYLYPLYPPRNRLSSFGMFTLTRSAAQWRRQHIVT